MKKKIGIVLLVIFSLYNILGTIAICSVYGSDSLNGDWVHSLLEFTFPIVFFSFGARFVSTSIFPVFIIQGIIQIIGTLIIYASFKIKE